MFLKRLVAPVFFIFMLAHAVHAGEEMRDIRPIHLVTWKDYHPIRQGGNPDDQVIIDSPTALFAEPTFSGSAWSFSIGGLQTGDNKVRVTTIDRDGGIREREYQIRRIALPEEGPGRFAIIGHRGAPLLAPENSLAGMVRAWEVGADGVEVDVHLTADNRIIVIHDRDTLRTTGEKRVIRRSHSDILRDMVLFPVGPYEGERIPLLEDVLDLLPPDRSLVIDIKGSRKILPYLTKLLLSSEKRSQIALVSYSWPLPARMAQDLPEVTLIRKGGKTSRARAHLKEMNKNGIDAVSLKEKEVSQRYVETMRAANKDVYVYTVNNIETSTYLIEWGVTHIITGDPELLQTITRTSSAEQK